MRARARANGAAISRCAGLDSRGIRFPSCHTYGLAASGNNNGHEKRNRKRHPQRDLDRVGCARPRRGVNSPGSKDSLLCPLGERQLDPQSGTGSGWAVDGQRSAERIYPVDKADEAGAPGRVGATYAVVAHRKREAILPYLAAEPHDRRVRMFGGVRKRFRHHEISGCRD